MRIFIFQRQSPRVLLDNLPEASSDILVMPSVIHLFLKPTTCSENEEPYVDYII